MDQPIVKFIGQAGNGHSDCGVACLAMMLGLSYQQALVLVASVKPRVLESGVEWEDLIRAARKKKVKLKNILAHNVDLDDEELSGILSIREIIDGKKHEHVVYLTHGLIFDGRTDAVYEPDVYLKTHNADAMSLLVKEN